MLVLMTVAPNQNQIMSFLPFILMFGILYLLIIRPQRKRQKEMQEMINNIKIKDKIFTTSGIIGIVMNIKNDKNTIVLKVDESTKIEFQKAAIAGLIEKNVQK